MHQKHFSSIISSNDNDKKTLQMLHIYFCPISIFFCILYISFSEKGADQVRLMYHRFCYSVLHVKWESLSAFFGSKIFHHHRYFDTVHCSNLDIKMLKICWIFPEIWKYMDNLKCKFMSFCTRVLRLPNLTQSSLGFWPGTFTQLVFSNHSQNSLVTIIDIFSSGSIH